MEKSWRGEERLGERCWGSTHNIGQLRLGDEILGLGTDKLLLEDREPGTLGLLDLELLDLVGNLGL